ncbi:M23 family metallopeptidase [Erythrobacter sp. LQ02-29]|uniref:M23 family metallopeptidase n=1 Tax=Erythrobacter sp. LQ02-29 TaxID=2920384 RepID=UPI001F4EB669|nr:M23 family metallopeptidase [Erythrobacter sp. LQ02-29]MCP9222250.1 M23 family metallopeptidase [Erythrobacter sp. LQ02-29]
MRRPAPLALAAAALLLVAAGNPATETRHTVEEGETLGGIANRAGVEKAAIAAANGLVEPYAVQAGQVLVIPRQRSHTVKAGETALGIALKYDVPLDNLAIANGLEKPYPVQIGQKLIIPAQVAQAPAPIRATTHTEPYFRWPHDGRVLLPFSPTHDGIDIAVDTGDMVRAAASGTVVFANTEPTRFGRQVLIDHGNGWQTSYGHLSRITVKKGDVIKTGERIGLAGAAGTATRPELHFEIRHDGKDIDPKSKLPPRDK